MIDAIDADMHARPGDAELTPWLLVLDCAPQHVAEGISQHHARHPAAHQTVLRPAELHSDTHSRWTRRTCAPSRARCAKRWPNISPSSSCKSSPTSNMSIWTPAPQCSDSCCSHSCTQPHRTQTARNIELAGWRFIHWNEVEQRELLAEAKRLLETGELFPRGTAEEPHAPDAEAEASDSEPEAHVMEPLADDHSSDSDHAPTGVEESAAPAAPAVAAAPKRAAMSLLERLQAIRIIHGSTPPS